MTHSTSAELTETAASDVVHAAEGAVNQGSPRLFHLDALRALLMFWGVLVHSGTLDPGNRLFRSFSVASGWVRMEAFFIISGFLGCMVVKRYGAKDTLKRRLVAIGVPFLATLVLLNPPTDFLIHTFHNGPIPFVDYLEGKGAAGATGPMNWHLHLWFLIALLVYSLLLPWAVRLTERGLAAIKVAIRPPGLAFLAMSLGVVAGCLASRMVFELVKDVIPVPLHYVTRSIGNFLPFYLVGILLFASANMRDAFFKLHGVQLLASCGLFLLMKRLTGPDPGWIEEVVILSLQTYLAMTLSNLLFWLAGEWLRGDNRLVRSLSDAAYTVYLFHFLLIYVFAHLLRGLVPGSTLLLGLVAMATFGSALLLHRCVIRRIPLFALLFNGKPILRK